MTHSDSLLSSLDGQMVPTTILEILRARGGDWCGAQTLAGHAFVGLGEVSGAIILLARAGYDIERHPRFGYRLTGTGGRLLPYEVSRGLGTTVIGARILAFETVGSTNDIAWSQASAAAPEGAVFFAEEQTAGRGRMGRQWVCPRGKGLLMSIVLRPKLDVSKQPVLTIMAAVAAARALQEVYQVPALIRWPNDLLVRKRKVGGILVEARALKNGSVFVLGIGLNTGLEPADIPEGLKGIATSLTIETRRRVDRVGCARALLRSLDRWYTATRRGEYGLIAEEWRHLSSTLGQRVTLADGEQDYHGRVLDLSLEDGLILRLDSGVTRVFPPGQFALKREGDVEATPPDTIAEHRST